MYPKFLKSNKKHVLCSILQQQSKHLSTFFSAWRGIDWKMNKTISLVLLLPLNVSRTFPTSISLFKERSFFFFNNPANWRCMEGSRINLVCRFYCLEVAFSFLSTFTFIPKWFVTQLNRNKNYAPAKSHNIAFWSTGCP